jgi:hypothetical protein
LFVLKFTFYFCFPSVRGIAGDGKEQYNIYYSAWFCLLSALFTFESKVTEYGFPTIKTFVKSWPFRAPGWIAILISDFFLLFWYVDLYINTKQNPDRVADQLEYFYKDIPKSQYEWLIFAASATLLPSTVFIFAEIFRDSSSDSKNEKPSMETYIEGLALLLLTLGWIPAVIVATTPGGFASVTGNAYYFTWLTTIFVLETIMWFIHDSRGGVHQTLLLKELEYKQHQKNVLEATRKLQAEAAARCIEEEGSEGRGNGEVSGDGYHSHKTTIGWDDPPDMAGQYDADDRPLFGEESGHTRALDLPNLNGTTVITEPTHSIQHPPSTTGGEAHVSAFAGGGGGFEMRDILEDGEEEEETLDESIRQEIRMRESNRRAYFDTLDDILE